MHTSFAIPVFLAGVFLITVGLVISGAVGAPHTRLFSESATDVSMWLFLFGIVAAAVGLRGASHGRRGA
jgi:hypothetical protein